MAWIFGGAITATGAAQQLTTTVGLVKAVRIYQHWNNTHNIYSGDSTLNPNATPTPTGVTGWAPPPPASPGLAPFIEAYEAQSMNGINTEQIYVWGTAADIILWQYIVQ